MLKGKIVPVCRGRKGTAATVEMTFFTPQNITRRDLRFLHDCVDTDSSLQDLSLHGLVKRYRRFGGA